VKVLFLLNFKFAIVTPLFKKTGFATGDPSNFRPISDLSNISRLLSSFFLLDCYRLPRLRLTSTSSNPPTGGIIPPKLACLPTLAALTAHLTEAKHPLLSAWTPVLLST